MADEITAPRVPGGGRAEGDRPVNYVCGFCGCTNTRRGEVLSMSSEARAFRDQGDKIEALTRDLERARQETVNANAKLETAISELDAARKGQRFNLASPSGRM